MEVIFWTLHHETVSAVEQIAVKQTPQRLASRTRSPITRHRRKEPRNRTVARFGGRDYRNVLFPDKWIITIFLNFTTLGWSTLQKKRNLWNHGVWITKEWERVRISGVEVSRAIITHQPSHHIKTHDLIHECRTVYVSITWDSNINLYCP